ncbi:MAG: AAA family ATPase [Planctomycetota bacterium]
MGTARHLHDAIQEQIGRVIVGQTEALRLAFTALVTQGHVLLEGVPGVAKTTLVRALARTLQLDYGRIQFTPDLMPSDIVGTNIYDMQRGEFRRLQGPVFTNVLLADEINRAPAKTQAALLEAMQERQVSIEGDTTTLPQPFLVLATQNPIEQEGTYPLPEAQLDRFLLKIVLGYPSEEEEMRVLEMHSGDNAGLNALLDTLEPVAGPDELGAAMAEVLAVSIRPEVARYLLEIVRRTRDHTHLALGGSPRAAVLLQTAARAWAALEERDYVIPDDIKAVLLPVLRHRVILTPGAEVEGLEPDAILRALLEGVAVPR